MRIQIWPEELGQSVEVDVLKISGQVRRVNVTIPERILNRLDGFARKRGESRSGLLSAAALEYLAAHALD